MAHRRGLLAGAPGPVHDSRAEGDLAEAQRLNGQVLQYFATGRYQQAIPVAQHVLEISEKALGL
jgi:hypothetical protein